MPSANSRVVRETELLTNLDHNTARWLADLTAAAEGSTQAEAEQRLHQLLLRAARAEVHRRNTSIHGPELDDLAYQAAADAMLSIMAKLHEFRGDSRFTTWAYKFVIFEVSAKLSRQARHHMATAMDEADWQQLPDRLSVDPADTAEARDLVTVVRHAVERQLTERQRRVFVALAVEGVPLDALVADTGTSRNAIYKAMFDARTKLRAALTESGYLPRATQHSNLEQLLTTDPTDVGCERAMELLNAYAELAASDPDAANERYQGVAAHLRGCGPCAEDLLGLLATIRSTEHSRVLTTR